MTLFQRYWHILRAQRPSYPLAHKQGRFPLHSSQLFSQALSQYNIKHTPQVNIIISFILKSMASKNDPYASYAKAYKIHSIENSKWVWDVSGNKKEENTLILCQYHGGDNQKFYLTPSNNGKWRIMTLKNGYCLQVDSIKAQSILYFGTVKGAPEEQWQIIQLKPNVYRIKAHHGMVIDVPGGTYKNQQKLITYPQHDGKNQQWVLQKA